MNIKIGKRGYVKEGSDKGYYILIQKESGTGEDSYLILFNQSPDMSSGIGHDYWAKDLEELKLFQSQSKWVIDWLE